MMSPALLLCHQLRDNDKMFILWSLRAPLHTSHLLKNMSLCAILLPGNIPQYGRGSHMNVEELKARLRTLLHQRDMLRFERDSLELFDIADVLGVKIDKFFVFRD